MSMTSHKAGSAVLIRVSATVFDFLQFCCLILSPGIIVMGVRVCRGGWEDVGICQQVERVRWGACRPVWGGRGCFPRRGCLRLAWSPSVAVPATDDARVGKGERGMLLIAAGSVFFTLCLRC